MMVLMPTLFSEAWNSSTFSSPFRSVNNGLLYIPSSKCHRRQCRQKACSDTFFCFNRVLHTIIIGSKFLRLVSSLIFPHIRTWVYYSPHSVIQFYIPVSCNIFAEKKVYSSCSSILSSSAISSAAGSIR